MSYSKINWVDGAAPALNATNLNRMDDGIYSNSIDIALAGDNINTLSERIIAINTALSAKADKTELEDEITDIDETVTMKINLKADKANTLAGYGITDAYDKTYINQSLNLKLDKRPFDTEPKYNSPNYITSGTVYNSVNSLRQTVAQNKADIEKSFATKNDVNSAIETASAKMIAKDSLLNTSTSINLTSLEDTEQTANGVTIAVRNNKISLSGTSTSAVNFILKLKKSVTLERGKAYCLSLQNFNNIKNSGCVFYPANSQTVISSSWLLSEVSAFKNAVATYTATENATVNSIKIAVATNRLVDNSCNLQLEQNNKHTAYSNPDLIKSNIKPELYQAPDYTMHYLYVSNDYNENIEGFGETKFNSILSANNSISDNSYHNRYTIIVMAGTYTDLQDKYAGMSDVGLVGYRGIMTKDYVYYESENIYNPAATVIKWDGATGFDKSTLKSEDIIKKCPFHLDLNVHTHIKGFTFDCKNIRYGIHLESGGTGYATDWVVSNCVFKWGGRADCVDYIGKTTVPVFGCGHSFGENGLIENCKIIVENCTVGYQSHENADNSSFGLALKTGANITIRNCDFGGTEIQARTLKGAYSDTPNVLTVDRCVNISEIKKLYAAPATKCDWTVVENLNKGE